MNLPNQARFLRPQRRSEGSPLIFHHILKGQIFSQSLHQPEQPLQTNAILQLNKKIFDIFFDAISWHFLPQNWL